MEGVVEGIASAAGVPASVTGKASRCSVGRTVRFSGRCGFCLHVARQLCSEEGSGMLQSAIEPCGYACVTVRISTRTQIIGDSQELSWGLDMNSCHRCNNRYPAPAIPIITNLIINGFYDKVFLVTKQNIRGGGQHLCGSGW